MHTCTKKQLFKVNKYLERYILSCFLFFFFFVSIYKFNDQIKACNKTLIHVLRSTRRILFPSGQVTHGHLASQLVRAPLCPQNISYYHHIFKYYHRIFITCIHCKTMTQSINFSLHHIFVYEQYCKKYYILRMKEPKHGILAIAFLLFLFIKIVWVHVHMTDW